MVAAGFSKCLPLIESPRLLIVLASQFLAPPKLSSVEFLACLNLSANKEDIVGTEVVLVEDPGVVLQWWGM